MSQGVGHGGNKPASFPEDVGTRMSALLHLIGNLTALKLIYVLLNQECSVGVLANMIGVKQPVASKYLRRMEQKGLLERRSVGQFSFYRVKDPIVHDIFNRVREYVDPDDDPGDDPPPPASAV